MAEDPQPQLLTLQQRIAALNASHIGRSPSEAPPLRPKPIVKQKSFNLPNENVISTTAQPAIANLPNGPPPLPVRKAPPPLPSRKTQQQHNEQVAPIPNQRPVVTATRTKSAENGGVKAPAWHEAMILPPITPKAEPKPRQKSFSRPQTTARAPSVSSVSSTRTTASNGSRPPPLPTRKSTDEGITTPARKLPPMPSSETLDRARKASFASVTSIQSTEPTPPLPTRRPSTVPSLKQARQSIEALTVSDVPPPIPTASRPDLAALQATKPKLNGRHAAPAEVNQCMTCRDFSGPDNHAAQFPRQNVASLQQLAQQLVAPFPSYTDKARAIFTWLHYNIDYNTRDFFAGNVKSSTPQSTLQSGLAVCEGYAALFTCLATYAGLESKVVSGHGKGFGHVPLASGAPLPPYEGNHAWNVVKIDNGEWKLIDSCWGAGHVQGANSPYIRKFSPERFTQSNEKFGIDHFPNDRSGFYTDRIMSWEEYIQIDPALWPYTFERPTIFDNAKTEYSIGKQTVLPPNRKISAYQQGSVRFQFGLFCPHWTLERHAPRLLPPVYILACGGIDGRNKHFVPFEHGKSNGNGGDLWYADVQARALGAPGETLTLFAVTSFGNRQDARGLSVQEFKAGIGRTAMAFTGIAAWELV